MEARFWGFWHFEHLCAESSRKIVERFMFAWSSYHWIGRHVCRWFLKCSCSKMDAFFVQGSWFCMLVRQHVQFMFIYIYICVICMCVYLGWFYILHLHLLLLKRAQRSPCSVPWIQASCSQMSAIAICGSLWRRLAFLCWPSWACFLDFINKLVGGFEYFLCSPLFGEDSHFD